MKRLKNRPKNKRGGHQKQADELDRSDPNGIAALSDGYLESLGMKNYSEQTINHHRSCLVYALQWLQERDLKRAENVTKPILESYQRMLYRYRKKDGSALGFTTQRYRLSVVKQFFSWLCRQNYILSNPASDIELPKADRRLPQLALSHQEVEQVMIQPNLDELTGIRDRAILEMLYSTGMRRLEMVNLQLQDLDRSRKVVMVRQGKGKKDRLLPVGQRALSWLERYLEEVRPELQTEIADSTVFLSSYGEALNKDFLSRTVRQYIDRANVGKSGSCHLLRHSMATLMLENGADVRYVQEMLGHAQLTTTEIYTQLSIKQLQEIHKKTHPAK